MKTDDIEQIITIKTESISQKVFLKLKALLTKYYFHFESTTQEDKDWRRLHILTLKSNFNSIVQMFEFNRELEIILKE